MSTALGSREKILVSARELFYFTGYQTTSVDDILRRCGVAKSNFYYHFRTKEELAIAVLKLEFAELEAKMLRVLIDRGLEPTSRFQRFAEALLAAQSDIQEMGGCPFGNFAAALSARAHDERDERFRMMLRELFVRIQSALEVCLQDGMDSGVFRSDLSCSYLAATVLAAIEGLMLMTKTHRDIDPMRQGLLVLQRLLRVA